MTTNTARRIPMALAAAGFGLMLLAGCGDKDGKQAGTQVAAKVGAEEISVHQVNQVLQRTPALGNAAPEAIQRVKSDVLEKLIDQQLAVEQATEAKLHRSPDVVNQIEAARREILVRAYMQKVAGNLPKPTEDELKKYHAEHPQLFSQRRIFNVQELVVPAASGMEGQLRRFAGGGKSIEEASNWLKEQNVAFNSGGATRAAEQLPMEVLAQIQGLQDGQSVVLSTPQAVTLLRVTSSQLTPLSEAEALPRIEQFLRNQRTTEAVTANLRQLREATPIVYMGEFNGGPKTDAAAAAALPKPTAAALPTAAPAPTVMEKGVAGLK